jgi:hypothetical protein
MKNPFAHLAEPLDPAQPGKKFFNLNKLRDSRYGRYMALRCICSDSGWNLLCYIIEYVLGE